MMLLPTDGKPLKTPLSALVFLLLLTHQCRGQSQLIGSPQPIVANLGGDIILPCYLVPAVNVADLTLEWTRPDMDPRFVHVMRLGHEMVDKKHELFKGRTSMFTDELKNGNISLKLSNVRLSDQGKYRCFIPELSRQTLVQLVCVSAAARPPVVTLSGLEGQRGGVVLQCESAGWYPEPEVLWLDAEGKLLSAGPPETVRGPDDLYTVSSRVTVEKRPSSSFTCRVQHHNTTRTTQTHFHVPDEFFKLQSSSSSIIIGLAVSLSVCILLMLAVSFFFLWREHIFKTKRKHSDKDQFLNEEEGGQLMNPDAVHMEAFKGNLDNKSKPKNKSEQQLLEEERREEAEKEVQTLKEELQRRKKDAEKEVQTLKEELQNKKKEVESKQSELQDLHAEKQRNENELQSLKKDLENKNRELEKAQKDFASEYPFRKKEELQKKKDKAEQEVENLQKKLETQQERTDTKTKELSSQVEVKRAEVQQLQEEGQRMETSLQTLMEEVESKWPLVSSQKFEEEQQRREEAEKKVHILEELQKKDKEQADTKWRKTDEELMNARGQLNSKEEEIRRLNTEFEEKTRREEADRKLKEEVESKVLTVPEEKTSREEAEKDLKLTVPPSASSPLHGVSEGNQHPHDMKRREEEAEGFAKEFQAGHFEGSDGSESVEPPLPPNTQTSEWGFHIEVDQQHNYIRLKNTSTEDKGMGKWKLDLQVNNNESIAYTFPQSFKLQAGREVTMWVKGHGRNHAPTELVWRDLKSLSSGDKLQVVLFNHKQETQYELCVTIP